MSNKILEKMNLLKEMVQRVDGNKIKTPFSDYGVVENIINQVKRGKKLSTSQIYLINEIYKKYNRKEVLMKNTMRTK